MILNQDIVTVHLRRGYTKKYKIKKLERKKCVSISKGRIRTKELVNRGTKTCLTRKKIV